MELPQQQQTVRISGAGGPEVLKLIPGPVPVFGDDEVLIEVFAAGVNRHDCNQRRRGPAQGHSDIPGLEVAGIVRAVGARAEEVRVGDQVCALTAGGGYAEFAVASAALAFPLEGKVDMNAGAALPEALFTVWHNFFNVAELGPGETVLIHGGTSGVGTMAIQLLSALGHPVWVTCGTEEKCALARELGAIDAFNYAMDDFVERIRQATQGRGVDVVLDMAGVRYAAQNLQALARRGRVVHLSPGDGKEFCAPLRTVMAKEAKITGSLLRPLPLHEKVGIALELRRRIWPLILEGRFKPLVQRVFPLAQAGQAHAMMESGSLAGKIVLACRGMP